MSVITSLYTRLQVEKIMLDRRGISAVEYGILIGFVGVALIGTLSTFSDNISDWFTTVTKKMNTELATIGSE